MHVVVLGKPNLERVHGKPLLHPVCDLVESLGDGGGCVNRAMGEDGSDDMGAVRCLYDSGNSGGGIRAPAQQCGIWLQHGSLVAECGNGGKEA
jgi:hypothetical protein